MLLDFEYEARIPHFDGQNQLGLLTDLGALRAVLNVPIGLAELGVSAGALFDWQDHYGTAEVGARADVRAVVLAAEGPAFCAGANLNWMRRMADYTREQNLADAAKLAEMLRVIYECPKPTIARVQGDVYAGGTGLVAACDMAVSVDTAGFCLSEVKIGLIPATISPYVIRAMGARAAHRYFLTAERFGAQEALRIGFVHEVVTAEQLDAKVDELVKALISASPNAVRACKKLVLDVADPGQVLATLGSTGLMDVARQSVRRLQAWLPGQDTVAQLLAGPHKAARCLDCHAAGAQYQDSDKTAQDMAYAVMGGLAVATILTLVFLPALYVVWFGIRAPGNRSGAAAGLSSPAAAVSDRGERHRSADDLASAHAERSAAPVGARPDRGAVPRQAVRTRHQAAPRGSRASPG